MSTKPLVQTQAANNPFAVAERADSALATAEQQRAIQEVQAALVIAQKFPRDENRSIEKIRVACQRQSLAEVAEYEYSRGGTKITGPTIELLKAVASRWGNIVFGWDEIERRNGVSTVMAYAWDQQTNARNQIKFQVRHWRDTQAGGYALTDERDIYEINANVAARRMRACMESVIDSDVVDLAVDECRKTLQNQSDPLIDRVRKMAAVFSDEFQVSVEMIEKRLGNKLDAISENQLVSLRRVYKSLKDGVGKREEFFKPDAPATEPAETNVKSKKSKEAPTPTTEPETIPIKDRPHNPDDDDGDLGPEKKHNLAGQGSEQPNSRKGREVPSVQTGPVGGTPATQPQTDKPKEEERPYAALMERLGRDGVSEETVMAFMRSKKLAKDTQNSLADLATAKLVDLLHNWDSALPTLKTFKR